MGPIIDQLTVNNYQAVITQIKVLGGNIVFSGQVIDRPGNYVKPTLVEAEPNWDIVNQENFCPILFVMTFNSIDQAIAINNQVDHGLSSAIFTKNIKQAGRFLSCYGSDCGIANIKSALRR